MKSIPLLAICMVCSRRDWCVRCWDTGWVCLECQARSAEIGEQAFKVRTRPGVFSKPVDAPAIKAESK